MALAHNPRIVTDGLVLCLDAANPKSYPGTGTTCTDLSGNGNHGTLFNGVAYSSSFNGFLILDGVDDQITGSLTANFSNNSITHLCLFRVITNPSVWQQISGVNNGGLYINGSLPNKLRFQQSVTGVGNILTDFNNLELNEWYYAGYTWSSGDHLKSYVNGIYHSQTSLTYSGTISPTSLVFGTYSSSKTNVEIATSFVYNRALTPEEIRQNFEALRGRYGV